MKNKKIIAIVLCIGIIISSVNVLFVSYAKSNQDKFSLSVKTNYSSKNHPGVVLNNNILPDLSTLKTQKNKQITMKLPEKDKVLYSGVKDSFSNDQTNNDTFNFSKGEIEQLLKDGNSISDIIKADEIGNKLIEKPAKLLEKKNKEGKNLETIEKEIMNERKQDYINKMKKKYPKEYESFVNENFNEDDISVLFAYINNSKEKSLDTLIRDYKQKGKDSLKINDDNLNSKVSKEKMDKYGLTSDDVEGLSENMISKVEALSKKNGIKVKDLLKKFKASRQQKGGR